MQSFFINDLPGATLLIFLAMMAGVAMERVRVSVARRTWKAQRLFKPNAPNKNFQKWDAASQLRAVMAAEFQKQALLNRSELRVFAALEREFASTGCNWRLMAQVSMGEILKSRNAEAYSAINSKRVDFLLVDTDGLPLHVIEYQGAGHYQNFAAARDAAKREALRKAGIGYHEVVCGDRIEDLRQLVFKLNRVEGNVAYPAFGKK